MLQRHHKIIIAVGFLLSMLAMLVFVIVTS